MSEAPRATVREIDGRLVLDDPDALAMIRAVAKNNCKGTLAGHAERIAHFKERAVIRGVDNFVIVLLNVDDRVGAQIAEMLMPDQGPMWQQLRETGQIPYARGLAGRDGLEELVTELDAETGAKLRGMAGKVAVVVFDHGVVEAFEV